MPRKQESFEAKMLDHFQGGVSLPVAQAQLAMLQAVVARRAQTLTPGKPAAKPAGPRPTPSPVSGPAPATPPGRMPNGGGKTPKPPKKAPGATPGVGPASTAVGGPAKPRDVEIPGTRLQEGDPGLPSGQVG